MKNKDVTPIAKGYKVTDKHMRCHSYQFVLGEIHTQPGTLVVCSNGFHFCEKLSHCFNYYGFDKTNRVFEIEALEGLQTNGNKSCTSEIRLIRELTWDEVLKLANEGLDNTGHSNTGNWNTGDRNTGYSNTGNWNTGNWNTGDRNTGNWNTGNWNTGDRNTGYSNTGDRNTGNWNTGYRNTGYSNTGDRNTGLFCTENAPFPIFDQPSQWTEQDFFNSKVYRLMSEYVDTKMWIPMSRMTDAEKEANRGWKTAEGYVKDIPFKEAFTNAWHNFSESNKQEFLSLPNFDAKKFEHITGVKI